MKTRENSIVLNPYYNYFIDESLKYTFGKTITIADNTNIEELVEYIEKNKIKVVYLVDFMFNNKNFLQLLKKEIKVKSILTYKVASLTFPGILYAFQDIMECYDRRLIHGIGCLDKGLSELLKKKNYNASHVMLDSNLKFSSKNSKYIGVILKDSNPNHNYYNALSAIKLSGNKYVKSESSMFETTRFVNVFDLKLKVVDGLKNILSNNIINIGASFTDCHDIYGIMSLDSGIPYIYGNTTIFKGYDYLNEHLVLKSDDDISELSEKIIFGKQNKEKIINEYKKFRRDYTQKVKSTNKIFYGI